MKRALLAATVVAMCGGTAVFAQMDGGPKAGPKAGPGANAARCEALMRSGMFEDTAITSAKLVVMGPAANKTGKALSFCEVTGVVSKGYGSRIGVVFRLPADWNGKVLGIGGGGFAGNLTPGAAAPGLARGYATLQNDAANPRPETYETAFGLNPDGSPNAIALMDFGFRAVHEMAVVGKAVVKAYYDKPARHAYFEGCSQGGHQALSEVQRYPDDFNGVIAGAPASSDLIRVGHVLVGRALAAAKLSEAQIYLVNRAVLRTCDAIDGLADGIVDNPAACRWDPAVLTCKSGESGDSCLTPAQVDNVRTAQTDHFDADGDATAYALPLGSELSSFAYYTRLKGDIQIVSGSYRLSGGGLKPGTDFTANDPFVDHTLVNNSLWGVTHMSENPDISPFIRRGGKLLMWTGMYDQLIPAELTIGYYETMQRVTGAQLAAKGQAHKLKDSAALFLAVGASHCFGGAGPSEFDGLSALENWVERGETPTRMVAHRPQPSPVVAAMGGLPGAAAANMTRPLCAWPAMPSYKGSGDPNDAANFACRVPPTAGKAAQNKRGGAS